MRIWDLPPEVLCRNHLLGEHRELHAIWSILTNNKKGYSRHPEIIRWRGRLKALYLRHQILVKEMGNRGYRHNSPLLKELATGKAKQDLQVDSYEDQIRNLKGKECGCRV
jgi:Pyrimidine dimer DNA glycosylase